MANLKRRIAERQTELKKLKRDISKGYIHGHGQVKIAENRIYILEIEIKSIGEQLKKEEKIHNENETGITSENT